MTNCILRFCTEDVEDIEDIEWIWRNVELCKYLLFVHHPFHCNVKGFWCSPAPLSLSLPQNSQSASPAVLVLLWWLACLVSRGCLNGTYLRMRKTRRGSQARPGRDWPRTRQKPGRRFHCWSFIIRLPSLARPRPRTTTTISQEVVYRDRAEQSRASLDECGTPPLLEIMRFKLHSTFSEAIKYNSSQWM